MNEKIFSYVHDNDDEDGCVFEGVLSLPDDGTPIGERQLCLRVITHFEKSSEVQLSIHGGLRKKETYMGCFMVNDNKIIADLLYPEVRLVTKTFLELT